MNIKVVLPVDKISGQIQRLEENFFPYPGDLLITAGLLAAVTVTGSVFLNLGFTESNIIAVYLLGVLLISIFTRSYVCSVISPVLSVILFNFFLTEPRLTFHAYGPGYPVTFAIMLAVSIITGTLAARLKEHAKLSAQAAFRTKVLFDTNRLLQQAQDDTEIIHITASQLLKLLDRDIIAYPEYEGRLQEGFLFMAHEELDFASELLQGEKAVAEWVCSSRSRAGATTEKFSEAACLYLPICINNEIYGVIGIHINGKPLDSFEDSVVLSILGESALAAKNSRNVKEKEKAAILAKNEQLRANLLRTISHDLRTPLTSISGNAANLISNFDLLDDGTRKQIFEDIYDDSQWLINLVENLLSITRIEEGRLHFDMSLQVLDDVIEEALRHINQRDKDHPIRVETGDDLILARMDAKLMIQVIINLVDNAVKHTPPGTEILITTEKEDHMALIHIADTGPGIGDEIKPKVFDKFYTGDNKIADCRRSLGLGLFLCKAIIDAHGGSITVTDNEPHGAIFTVSIPSGEVTVNE